MGTKWNVFTNNLDLVNSVDGLVEGPAISTDNAVARFDGTTGALLQNSGTTLSDADLLSTGELNLTTDLAVEYGGTGRGTGTAFSVVCSGTTATGAQQSVSGVGSSGQVLTSGGAATLPTWTSVAGTGDVTASANMTDNAIVRGDGGAKGVQDSGILIDDTDNLSAVASIDITVGGDLQINSTSVLNATTLGAGVLSSSLTAVGTIGTGVWEGTAVTVPNGGTGATTLGDGFILLGSGVGTITALDVTAKGSIIVGDGTTDPVALAVGTDTHVLTADSGEASGLKWAAAGAGGMPETLKGGLAADHKINTTTAFAPTNYRDFGSLEMQVRSFDDTGPEYMQGAFRVPADLGAGASSVTFEIVGSAATAVASKNVKFTFDFIEVADDGLLTGAYGSAEVWDDQSISGTQDDQDIISNTETITNLGWTAGNMIYYRLYREAATTTNLVGDYDVIAFWIRIPQA